jgi:hypothetical protein
MKSTLLFLIVLSIFSTNAQYAFQLLEGNNVSATINNSGSQFTTVGETAGYLVPQNASTGLVYSAQFWYAGVDEEGMLRAALGGSFYESDVFIGPFSADYSDPGYMEEFAQSLYSFCLPEIQQYVMWWECQNGILTEGCESIETPSVDLLQRIYAYPAHGNVGIGQDYWMLPFVDRDQDGTYNPANGDVPIIKGCCGTYLIQNDTRGTHESGALAVGLQMVYHFYQFSDGGLLDDVTFVDLQTVNKGIHDFQEFRYGFLVDGDVGYPYDDYMGTDAQRQMAFFYNADNFDEDELDIEFYGLGTDPPAIGVVALKQELNSIVPVSNGFSTVMGKWMNLGGLQASSQPFMDPDDNATTFVYTGEVNNSSAWNESSSDNIPGDRRLLMSSVVNNFQAGDTILQTYAIIYSRSGDHIQNAVSLGPIADEVKEFYLQGEFYSCNPIAAGLNELNNDLVRVFPNPTNDKVSIYSLEEIAVIEIYDLNGRMVQKETTEGPHQVMVNVSQLEEGIYSLKVRTIEGVYTKRVMKY